MPQTTITFSGTKTATLPSPGQITMGPLTFVNSNGLGAVTDQALVSGANTILIPNASLMGVLIVPPAGNTVTMTLKGVTGDTGVPLNVAVASFISLPASSSSFVITAGGSVTPEFWWF